MVLIHMVGHFEDNTLNLFIFCLCQCIYFMEFFIAIVFIIKRIFIHLASMWEVRRAGWGPSMGCIVT